MKELLRQTSVVITTVVMLGTNAAATLLPINGQSTAEISDRYPTLFTPAGYVFSIWGLIYIALAVFTAYQALPSQKHSRLQASIGWWLVLSNLFNTAWILAWHYNLVELSVLIMLGLLVSLLMIYVRLHLKPVAPITAQQRWLTSRPISLYLGWISVATIANISVLLYVLNWNGLGIGPDVWTWVMSGIAVILALVMVLRHRDYIYAAVIVWALVGVAIKYV